MSDNKKQSTTAGTVGKVAYCAGLGALVVVGGPFVACFALIGLAGVAVDEVEESKKIKK